LTALLMSSRSIVCCPLTGCQAVVAEVPDLGRSRHSHN